MKACDTSEKHGLETRQSVFAWFDDMIEHCLDYASEAKKNGRAIVGILCEYTPRELILAAGAVPVCLCGGSQETIPAAEADLPVGLCPLIKSTYGYHAMKSNPFLEMADLVVAETTCDGKKKMYELMGRTRPMYVLELPQKPDDPDAMEHWHREIVKLKTELERRFGAAITEDRLAEAIGVMNRERRLRRRLAELMAGDPPPMTGRQLLQFKSSISGIAADFEPYARIASDLEKKGADEALSGRVRVLLTGVPTVHGAEKAVDLIESHGGVVVCQENCTGIKPLLEDVAAEKGDLLRAVAEKYFHLPCSVMTPNRRRLEVLAELAAKYRPECVVELTWQGCLTYDVEAKIVGRMCREKLNLPYLHVQTDYTQSDSARIAVRLEALFETVRGPCGAKKMGQR
jgi:benzoyl-CoA reductase/2-hydroxyglutaryl-CoA dehydratase subunit BcrC/BadD/HgdB